MVAQREHTSASLVLKLVLAYSSSLSLRFVKNASIWTQYCCVHSFLLLAAQKAFFNTFFFFCDLRLWQNAQVLPYSLAFRLNCETVFIGDKVILSHFITDSELT